ncbi:unnamed protein product, partial [Closterium sp. NIES-53]
MSRPLSRNAPECPGRNRDSRPRPRRCPKLPVRAARAARPPRKAPSGPVCGPVSPRKAPSGPVRGPVWPRQAPLAAPSGPVRPRKAPSGPALALPQPVAALRRPCCGPLAALPRPCSGTVADQPWPSPRPCPGPAPALPRPCPRSAPALPLPCSCTVGPLPNPAPVLLRPGPGPTPALPRSQNYPPQGPTPREMLHYTNYTIVFPLHSKGEVLEVLIDWIRGARRQLSESFGSNLPVLRLHSDRGGEFSSDLLRAFCLSEGIRQTFTLPASPQQNGIAERRIGMVMDAARTSMIHAAAPHFLWPFAVQYAAHRINLQPRVSLPETTPTLRWTGKVGDVSVFRVWGSRAFVRDTSSTSCPPVPFPVSSLASLLTHPGGSSTTPPRTYRTASPPPPPLFLAPGTPLLDPLPPQGPGPSGVSQVDRAEPVEVAVDSGAETGRAESGGAETRGAESEGAETGRAELGGRLREWYSRRYRVAAGAAGAGAAGGTGGASGATGGAGAAR